jgi:adenylate kinase
MSFCNFFRYFNKLNKIYFLFFLFFLQTIFAKPTCLILVGPPGSGKGTQGKLIENYYFMSHISTGDLLREQISNRTQIGVEIDKYISKGMLVPDSLILNMLLKRAYEKDCINGLIIDGSSRTINQAQFLYENFHENFDLVFLIFQIDFDTILDRNLNRLTCSKCSSIYNLKYSLPKKFMTCDVCHQKLFLREDDNEKVIINRYNLYNKNFVELEKYYKNVKNVYYLNANDTKENIFENIKSIIDQLK